MIFFLMTLKKMENPHLIEAITVKCRKLEPFGEIGEVTCYRFVTEVIAKSKAEKYKKI